MVFDHIVPVSYTHLDVYKRQIINNTTTTLITTIKLFVLDACFIPLTSIAVSIQTTSIAGKLNEISIPNNEGKEISENRDDRSDKVPFAVASEIKSFAVNTSFINQIGNLISNRCKNFAR